MLELCEQGDLLRRLGAEPSHCLPEDDVAIIAEALELRSNHHLKLPKRVVGSSRWSVYVSF